MGFVPKQEQKEADAESNRATPALETSAPVRILTRVVNGRLDRTLRLPDLRVKARHDAQANEGCQGLHTSGSSTGTEPSFIESNKATKAHRARFFSGDPRFL